MKNHWLDRKIDNEIDAALNEIEKIEAEFKDSDFVDLSTEVQHNDRYKGYDRSSEGWDETVARSSYDKNVVKAILDNYKNDSVWLTDILAHIASISPPVSMVASSPDSFSITIDSSFDPNFTISTSTVSGDTTPNFTSTIPGGDGIVIADLSPNGNIKSEFGEICGTCGEEMWPMNTAEIMMQGDPMCKCNSGSGNLDIFYPDNKFIQNELMQVISDKIEKNDVTQYQTMYTPVVAGTMTGTIHWDKSCAWGWVFAVMSDGTFDFRRFEKNDAGEVVYLDGQVGEKRIGLDDAFSLQKLAEAGGSLNPWYDEMYYLESNLNCTTGVLELHYKGHARPRITVSYEYQKVESL